MNGVILVSARLAVVLSVGLWLVGGQAADAQVQQRRFNIGDVVDTDGQLLKIHECRIRPNAGYEECLIQGWEGGGPSSQKSWMDAANIIASMERMESRTGRSAVISGVAPPAPAAATPARPPALPNGAQVGRRFNIGDVVDTDGQLLKIHECRIRPNAGYEECLIQGWDGGGPSSQKSWFDAANIIAGMERMESRTGRSAVISRAAGPAPVTGGQPQPAAPNGTPPAPATAQAGLAGQCDVTKYGGPVPGSVRASDALFRQKIADNYTMRSQGTFKVSVGFESFSVGTPIRNAVANLPGIGAVRVNNGAPPNAAMYPVVSRHIVCEQGGTSVERWRVEGDYYCFVSKDEEWTCASGGSGRPPKITAL